MKRHKILFLILLIQIFILCSGCASAKSTAEDIERSAAPQTASETDFSGISAAAEASMEEAAIEDASVENVVGTFEGLEDNHTAVFSFDGVETVFYFDAPAVQDVLSGAIIGSRYTLSYDNDSSLGYVITRISEF